MDEATLDAAVDEVFESGVRDLESAISRVVKSTAFKALNREREWGEEVLPVVREVADEIAGLVRLLRDDVEPGTLNWSWFMPEQKATDGEIGDAAHGGGPASKGALAVAAIRQWIKDCDTKYFTPHEVIQALRDSDTFDHTRYSDFSKLVHNTINRLAAKEGLTKAARGVYITPGWEGVPHKDDERYAARSRKAKSGAAKRKARRSASPPPQRTEEKSESHTSVLTFRAPMEATG